MPPLHEIVAVDEEFSLNRIGVRADPIVHRIFSRGVEFWRVFHQLLAKDPVHFHELGIAGAAVPYPGEPDRQIAVDQIATHIDEKIGRAETGWPFSQALAIVESDHVAIPLDDRAQRIGPGQPFLRGEFDERLDMVGFVPIVVVEKGDERAVAQEQRRAVNAMSEEAVPARRPRQFYDVNRTAVPDPRQDLPGALAMLWNIDHDQVLDVGVGLALDALETVLEQSAAGRRRDDGYRRRARVAFRHAFILHRRRPRNRAAPSASHCAKTWNILAPYVAWTGIPGKTPATCREW